MFVFLLSPLQKCHQHVCNCRRSANSAGPCQLGWSSGGFCHKSIWPFSFGKDRTYSYMEYLRHYKGKNLTDMLGITIPMNKIWVVRCYSFLYFYFCSTFFYTVRLETEPPRKWKTLFFHIKLELRITFRYEFVIVFRFLTPFSINLYFNSLTIFVGKKSFYKLRFQLIKVGTCIIIIKTTNFLTQI